MSYPKRHKNIVKILLRGEFILQNSPYFESIKENQRLYEEFFLKSFGFRLCCHPDYIFLQSREKPNNFSNQVALFIALLAYEIDKRGKNIFEEFNFGKFSFSEVNLNLKESIYSHVLPIIKTERKLKNFYDRMKRRKIIDEVEPANFIFTAAYKEFFDFAIEITKQVRSNSKENSNENSSCNIQAN